MHCILLYIDIYLYIYNTSKQTTVMFCRFTLPGLVSLCALIVSLSHYLGRMVSPSAFAVWQNAISTLSRRDCWQPLAMRCFIVNSGQTKLIKASGEW